VTDGEFRRLYWHFDFFAGLEGVALVKEEFVMPLSAVEARAAFVYRHHPEITGRISWRSSHPFVQDFRFVADRASDGIVAKHTIPAPGCLHYVCGPRAVADGFYKEMDSVLRDLRRANADAVRAFAEAGCRYLQIDDPIVTVLCDPKQVAMARERGVYYDGLRRDYIAAIDAGVRERPADMIIGVHLCRGNFISNWVAAGGYEPIAEQLFGALDADVYFMEYDNERAGGFEPLRYLPKSHKTVVLGLVTSKRGELENPDQLKRRIDEAARYVPLEQLALSPQCGFASTEEGNDISEQQQWAKLRLCVDVARAVWGNNAV
jgi:5-methyltetrahydropteroyltriglutamate--homocysteine methyltransferase